MATDAVKIRDRILLKRAIHGKDRKSLGQLHTKYYPRIKHYIASCVSSIEEAEDLAQNVFLGLCKGNDDYKEYLNAEAYLFGMARKFVGQHYRSRKKQVEAIGIDSVDEIAAGDEAGRYQMPARRISLQERKIIQDLVNQLPPKAQQAVRLRFLEGLSPQNAAKKAGCSANTFYQRLNAGVKAVKKLENKSGTAK